MKGLEYAQWTFGGPLSGAPPEAGWVLFGCAGGIVALLAWISYRTAVTPLTLASTALLTFLRTATITALLFCLANPISTSEETATVEFPKEDMPPRQERLAVVVDQSDSMTTPDNRGRTRLDDALNRWPRFEQAAQNHFESIDYYQFASTLQAIDSLENIRQRNGSSTTTLLHDSLRRLLKVAPEKRPSAIVALTDGLDTSASTSESATLISEAVAASVPLYFITGTNRSGRPSPYFRVRDLQVPATAFQATEFFLEATLEAFSRSDRSVRVSLWQNERRISVETIELPLGATVIPWKKSVIVIEPETVAFSLRWGETEEDPVIGRGATRVMAAKERLINVLVFQNGLDWGMRHLTDAVRSDPNFKLLTLLSTDLGLSLARSADTQAPLLGKPPTEIKALSLFDCILLFQATPRSLSAAQQDALVEFTRQGGALIVVNPPEEFASEFSQAPLGAVLPVVFLPLEKIPATAAPISQLQPFVLTDQGAASSVFSLPRSSPATSL
ncbi:MAG TPA: hypothetical protein PLN52_01235, partial [Opitutaceae bacterium]|nr:hypothetical protein [Opitutaceae bacterium]